MNTRGLKQIGFVSILIAILVVTFGTENISYAQEAAPTITASVETPLSEATLHQSIVTLTLSGRSFGWPWDIRDAVSVSGIEGVTVNSWDVDRVSDTQITVELEFAGDIDTDTPLVFTVGANAIEDYESAALTAQLPVTAVVETLTAFVEVPLSEAMLDEGVVTLTLSGRSFVRWASDIEDALTVTGIEGVRVSDVNRVRGPQVVTVEEGPDGIRIIGDSPLSDRQVTVKLTFFGDIDTDTSLVFTLGAEGIANYNGPALTAQLPVTAIVESLAASTRFPLTERTLHDNIVTLTLTGGSFGRRWDIEYAVSVSGIEGVTVDDFFSIDRVSDTEVTVELAFYGDIDTDATLVVTVGADAIAGYGGEALTAQLPVTAIKQSNATISLSPNSIISPPPGEAFTIDLNIAGGENVAGFQAIIRYDEDTLRYVKSAEGDYLPADTLFVNEQDDVIELVQSWINAISQESISVEDSFDESDVNPGFVDFVAIALEGVSNGDGRLTTLTFEVIDVKNTTITLSDVYLVDREGIRWEVEIEGTEVVEPADDVVGDVNRDGVVDIQDLTLVASRLGQTGENRADINGDGIVNVADLVLTANAFGGDAAAPPRNPESLQHLSAAQVKQWLTQAQHLPRTDPAYRRGVGVLEQLLTALTPKETMLLANYPNPFNPETWIPYHLAKPAEVMLTIYSVDGVLVRTLALGHQPPGRYQSRSRAAYWDGQNDAGEPVASGVYFYTLTAGKFSATRKMLIRK